MDKLNGLHRKIISLHKYKHKNNAVARLVIVLAMTLALLPRDTRAGEYAADFLRIGVGARALAMGGAFTALSDDATSFYWNPAGLTRVKNLAVHFDHVPMFGGISQFNSASLTMGFDGRMAVNLSWIRLGVDDIPRYAPLQGTRYDRLTRAQYRSTGEAEGTFANTDDAVMISFSRTEYFDLYLGGGFSANVIPAEFSMGVTAKYIRQSLDNAVGTGQGLDAGAMLRFVSSKQEDGQPDTWLGFGAMVRDLSRTRIIWSTSSKHQDNVQTAVQAGIAASKLFNPVRARLTLSFDKEFGFYQESRMGMEVTFFNLLSIRGGLYKNYFSAGAGISIFGLNVDYAFVSGELDNTHRVSGSFYF